jgi:murein DD-endopeptidase MepM/ murein hydrolase activator NlpD
MTQRLELFYPCKPFYVFQHFGENDACVKDGPGAITDRQVVGKIHGVCPAGYSELYPQLGMKGHTGQDLRAYHGQFLRAMIDGIVESVSTDPHRGMGVDILTEDRRDMGKSGVHFAKVRQWHLMQVNVAKGDRVKCGDVIGLADTTGISAGDHDHVELKPVERTDGGTLYNVLQDNGYFGAVDPQPFWNGVYAEDWPLMNAKVAAWRAWIDSLLKLFH